jgi:lipopolysaccharide transport system ATP-binding protein
LTVQPAVRVADLSKRYLLGEQARLDTSFRELLVNLAWTPWSRLRRNRRAPADPSFWALRDVSFDVPAGEVIAIIGRNGAGKSTLLKVLSRITAPTGGRIELRGRVASLLEVGTGFHPELTGRENVFLNGAILGMRRAEIVRKFDGIVEFAEVARFIDTPVKRYSSGMYLRLAFAVAAHLDSEILLVDEVLAVGDAEFQQKCLGKMQDVSRGGRTVLFISHNMAAVSALCSRAIVLDGGRTVFDGRTVDALRHYLSDHLDAGAATWDLEMAPRTAAGLGDVARLTSLAALTARPEGFAFGEPLRFRVSVASKVPMDGIVCAINLDDMTGARLATFESDERAGAFRGLGPGEHRIEVAVQAFGLRPGTYYLSASLYSGGHYHDYVVRFGAVSVRPFDDRTEDYVQERPDRGAIHAPATWRVLEAVEVTRA